MAKTAATQALGQSAAGHPPQGQEQQDRRGGVQEHVGQMMAAGLQAIKLAVQHVREPSQRVPVGGLEAVIAQAIPSTVRPRLTCRFA